MIELDGNACLHIEVHLKTDYVEDKDDAKTAPKDLLDLIDKYERRSQLNIKLPLEVNLGSKSEPKIILFELNWIKDLKIQLIDY